MEPQVIQLTNSDVNQSPPWALFMAGYNAGIKGADLAEMQTQDEIEGWWYARTPAQAGGITEDAEFIRWGGN